MYIDAPDRRIQVLHLVKVATGATQRLAIAVPQGTNGLNVSDFDGRYAYLLEYGSVSESLGRAWRFDTTTRSLVALANLRNVFAVRNGSAWLGAVDPHDPNPPARLPADIAADSLVEVSLSSGAHTTWIYRPGQSIKLLDVDDAGRPIVWVNAPLVQNEGEMRRIDKPASYGELISTDTLGFFWPLQPDGDRIWLGSVRGLYLYTPEAGLQKVFAETYYINPAGFCR